ncbi:hypothetical protein JYU04_01935 [Dehalococcoides mccartyi]|nr:hypothetical protein [Dehalococcoides mccartyi]
MTLIALAVVVVSGINSVSAHTSGYLIDQGGVVTEVDPISSANNDLSTRTEWQAVVNAFSVDQTSFVFLHEDDTTGELSLGFVHGDVGGSTLLSGYASIEVTGLPDSSSLAFSDDSSEFSVSPLDNSASGSWAWLDCCTDGGAVVLGSNDFDIDIDASFAGGGAEPITLWVFLSGDGTATVLDTSTTLSLYRDIDDDGDGVHAADDCDDTDATMFPGNVETNDGKDNDCDGVLSKADVLIASGVGGAGLSKNGKVKFFNTTKAYDNAGKKK